jgi:cytidylate kinase
MVTMKRDYIIAIDGPAASGKSTTAKELARWFGYTYIDSGAMYRAVALKIIDENIDHNDRQRLEEMLSKIKISFETTEAPDETYLQRIFLDGKDVSCRIREQNVTKLSSEIAVIGRVRERLVDMQREMGNAGGVIMDGRDIGTVVFPDADFKFYLTASVKTRAFRRWKELADPKTNPEEIEKDLLWRDHNDSNRAHSPLRKAEDAIIVDTTDLTIEEQVNYILNYIKSRQ